MFEKLIVELINRTLGDYIENLDPSQLNISLWNGDVRLENLNIKSNALESLEIPIEVKQGLLGSLVLKIPYKNLYSEPTVAELDGLYILAVPVFGMSYDVHKETKFEAEAKQKKLREIEEAKQRSASTHSTESLGMVEKMALQVIKNLQVKIKNVHIRYEDRVTCPDHPFIAGVSLKELAFQTTDTAWKPCIIKESVTQLFHKLVEMNNLSVYFNSYMGKTKIEMMKEFYSDIQFPNKETEKRELYNKMTEVFQQSSVSANKNTSQFVLCPISASAKFRYEAFPEKNGYKNPQLMLDLDFRDLNLEFSKKQYTTLVVFGDSMDRIVTMNKYRKYRLVAGSVKLSTMQAWKFAYSVVLGEVVRRRREMWSWDRMKRHRTACREYTNQYKYKLTKDRHFDQKKLLQLENELDVFNIVICRQVAENLIHFHQKDVKLKKHVLPPLKGGKIVTSQGKILLTKKSKKKAESSGGGWFGGWFGGGSKDTQSTTDGEDFLHGMRSEFAKMDEAEKAKLYAAINYQEDGSPMLSIFPYDFEARTMKFNLKSLGFLLHDDNQQIMKFKMFQITANVGQFPSANCSKVIADISSISLHGLMDTPVSQPPQIVGTMADKDSTEQQLFRFELELNPLDQYEKSKTASETESNDPVVGQKIRLVANPVEIVYHANTVIRLVDFLEPSEEIRFRELSAALSSQLESMRDMTATGLKHMIEQRAYTDIQVDLKPSCLILPETGVYTPNNCRLLLLDLGRLSITSESPKSMSGINTLMSDQKTLDFNKMKDVAYDCLKIRLSSLQLMVVDKDVDWRQLRIQREDMRHHILRPLAVDIKLYKCIVTDDIRLPRVRLTGHLPELVVDISEVRVKQIMDLVSGIPFPQAKVPPDFDATDSSAPQKNTMDLSHYPDVLDPRYQRSTSVTKIILEEVVSEDDDDDDDQYEDAVSEMSSPSSSSSPKTSRKSAAAKKHINFIDVQMSFVVKRVTLSISHQPPGLTTIQPFMDPTLR